MRHRRGFTLLELLIVIGIIGVLFALLLPSLWRARDVARETMCKSNQRQLAMAFLSFAADHQGQLPGNWWDGGNPEKDYRAWLRNSNEPFGNAPQGGTIYPYVNRNDAVYRCPSLENLSVSGGTGSNGRFDYAATIIFSGAKVGNLGPGRARFVYPDGRVDESVLLPLIVEEEPQGGINGGNNEGGHTTTDRMGHAHRGGAPYASVDGSVSWFKEPLNANCGNWFAKSPKGNWVTLYNNPQPSWGWWNRQ